MGIARGMIKLLMREAKRERFEGVVATMGRQDVYATGENIEKWSTEASFNLTPGIQMTVSNKKEFSEKGYITDDALFLSLGFDKVESIDYSDFEQCTIVHDLNEDVPEELYNKYDLIFDGGTSEHIFNFPKALANYNKMLKVGGRIIHSLPSSNHVDHGFYMFSPTLFYDYYFANKWEILDSLFINYSHKHDTKLWNIYQYTPGCLDRYSIGGLTRGLYLNYFVAKKNNYSTFDASVQQGSYLRTWEGSKSDIDISLAKRITNRLPVNLKRSLLSLYFRIPLRYSLKLIARY